MQYLSTADQRAIEQTYKITVIIALAFCFTPLLLVGLAWILGAQHAVITDPERYLLLNKAAYGGALVAGLIVVGLRRFWTNVLLRAGKGKRPAATVLNQLRLLAILSGVFGELVAILGFVAYSLTADFQFCWRLGVVGLLLILYSFPRRGEWERAVAQNAQA